MNKLISIVAVAIISCSLYAESFWQIGEGVAATREQAEQGALRNAIERSIGVFILGETRVERARLVSEKILAYSKGYIEGYEVMSESNDNGLITVKVLANVKQEQLCSKLFEIPELQIDGGLISINAKLDIERKKVGLVIIGQAVDELLKNSFDYEVSAPNLIKSQTTDDGEFAFINFTVHAKPRLESFKAFERLMGKFKEENADYGFDCRITNTLGVTKIIKEYHELLVNKFFIYWTGISRLSLVVKFNDKDGNTLHTEYIPAPLSVKDVSLGDKKNRDYAALRLAMLHDDRDWDLSRECYSRGVKITYWEQPLDYLAKVESKLSLDKMSKISKVTVELSGFDKNLKSSEIDDMLGVWRRIK